MSAFDPANTFSGSLPTLPPIPRDTSDLDVLDPRFPIRLSEPAHIFWQLTQEWDDRETVISQTISATQQAAVSEERFVLSVPETMPLPAIAPPVPYPPLAEATLTHEWDTGPGEAIPAGDEPWTCEDCGWSLDDEPRKHRHHGRFAAAGGA